MKILVFYSIVFFLTIFTPSGVTGQTLPCMDFAAAIESLEHSYKEAPIWRGRSVRGTMVVLFEAEKTKTWTILIVMPNGKACPVDIGGSSEHLVKENKHETRLN